MISPNSNLLWAFPISALYTVGTWGFLCTAASAQVSRISATYITTPAAVRSPPRPLWAQTAEACGKAAADPRGGIRCPSHRVASRHFRKRKQRKGIMGKQILTNSSGENFRFHKRKSTLFNGEKCENLIWQFSVTKNWKSSLEAFVIFLFCWEPLKKTKREALPTRKPLPAPSAPPEPAGRTPWKNFCRTQQQGCQIKDRMPS